MDKISLGGKFRRHGNKYYYLCVYKRFFVNENSQTLGRYNVQTMRSNTSSHEAIKIEYVISDIPLNYWIFQT